MYLKMNASRKKPLFQASLFAILQIFAFSSGYSAPVDFKPYVSLDATTDSNYFRLSDTAAMGLGAGDLSEDYIKAALGSTVTWQHQRQKFNIDAQINRSTYNQFDQLDFTGGYLTARWNWVGGRLWKGKVNYRYSQDLKSFENSLVPRRDIKTINQIGIEADRKINQRWFVRLGGQYREIDFVESARNNKEETSLKGGIFYLTRDKNTVGVELRVIDSVLPERDADLARRIDDGYVRSSLDAIALWVFSGKSKISANLGYTEQVQDNISVDDFNGFTGRITHYLKVSTKTSVESSIWRVLSTLSDEIANYAVVSGAGVKAGWGVANKTVINAGVDYEQRDFQEDIDLITASFSSRKDDVYSYWLGLTYKPIQNLSFDILYKNGKRDSNRELRNYNYDSFMASVRFSFN